MKKYVFCLAALLFAPMSLAGAEFPDAPSAGNYVVDQAGIIDSKYEEYINSLAREVSLASSVSMAVLTVPAIGGDINVYTEDLINKWFTLESARDKGLVIVIAEDDHEVVTDMGTELSKVLTSAKLERTYRNIIIPNFKQHEYGRGVYWAMRDYAKLISEAYDIEFTSLAQTPGYEEEDFDDSIDNGCWGCWQAFACLGWMMWWDSNWRHWDNPPRPHHHHDRHDWHPGWHRPHNPHHHDDHDRH